MDHIYSVCRKIPSSSFYGEWVSEGSNLCCVSSRNTIAFTSVTDLSDSFGKVTLIHVYVADLNIPWEAHKVTSHSEEVTCIEWDVTGTKLLIADSAGHVQIWIMKDYLLNEWTQLSMTSFPGENILSISWFHNGKKIGLNMEKKDSPLFLEKYNYIPFGPSVRQFGGRPCEGCIVVCSTGLIGVLVLQSEGGMITGTDILGHFRTRLKVVDICCAKNGDFLVVTSDGHVNSSIPCYRVTVKISQDKCFINCQPFSSFYLNCHTAILPEEKQACTRISHLKFVLREAADAVVVAVSGSSGSIVELWELQEKPVTVHKMFYNNTKEQPKTVGWRHHASSSSNSPVVAVATPRLSIYDITPPPSYILVAYKDNEIKCFFRESLRLVCSISVNAVSHRRDEIGMVQHVPGTTVSDMQLTWTGSALIAINSLSELLLYRLSPITDPGGPMSTIYAVTVLEYCLITGIDWWDVILSLRPGLIETVCEKLSESFNRQPVGSQQYLLSRFLSLKGSFCRCLSNGQAKAGDCHALIMLNAVAAAIKGLLRPRDLSSQEKGPAENLTAIMSSKGAEGITNIDKVLLHLEHKEFAVEPPILQSLQHLNQWVADFTLNLMASLSQQYHTNIPGSGLLTDPKALNTLRELLIIIRIWSFMSESCLPVFTKMADNLDILSLLFKLLTKILLSLGSEPDESLLDECCWLPSQVLIPSIDLGVHSQGVASPALFMNSLPLQFEYCVQPHFLHYTSKVRQPDSALPLLHKMDIVRHVSLGASPPVFRKCTRCSSSSLVKPAVRSAATRAWDQRWLRFCPCGGQWKLKTSKQ